MGDSDKWFWRSSPLFRFLILISEAKAQMRPSEIPHAAQEYDRVVLSFCCCCCCLDSILLCLPGTRTSSSCLHILSARVTAALIPCPSPLPGFNFLNFIITITVHACTGHVCTSCAHVGGQETIWEASPFLPTFCDFQGGTQVTKFMQQATLTADLIVAG